MTDTTSKRSDAGKRLREYQQVLGSFTRIASESLPLGALLHHAAAQAARVTDIKRAKVMRYTPEKGDLIVAAGVGWKPGIVGHATLGMDHRSPPGRSIQTAGAVAIEDLPNDKEYDHSGLLQDHGVISLLNVPIMIDGRTWGVLEVDTQHKTKFDEVDVEFLGTMANIVAGAIARHEAEENSVQALTHAARQKLEAETALRELQHRTKNNLQVIISLLAIKKREVESQEAREVLSAAMRRVEAVALAHDLLARGDETGSVDWVNIFAACAPVSSRSSGRCRRSSHSTQSCGSRRPDRKRACHQLRKVCVRKRGRNDPGHFQSPRALQRGLHPRGG